MGYLSDYNQKNGIETPSSTGSTGFLQQYNSQPHPTTTPIAKPKATTPVKITQPQTQTPAKPGLLQQAENFIAPVIKTVEKAPIIGKPLQEAVATAKEVVKETPAVIKAVKADAKSTVKHPVETAAGFTLGVGKALTDFSISTLKTINNIKNGIDTAVYNAVGYKPPKNWDPRENRDNMVKILEGFQKTRDQNFSIMGKDTNRGIAIGNFIGSFVPYALAAEAATIAVGSALTTPTITKFAPNAIKLAPTIGNAVSFLGLGQLTFDKNVDKSRVEKAKNDLIMLGVFEAGGYIAKELSSATKNLISKVFNSASKQIKSSKGADLNVLETQINEVKDAVKKDTGKNAETVLARNIANASDSQIKVVNDNFGFKESVDNSKTAIQPQITEPIVKQGVTETKPIAKPKEITNVETITKETNKKAPFSSKEAKATQQTFSDELNTIATTAKNEAELTSRTEKAINNVIEKVKNDRTGLAGVRTSIVKQMNDLAGVTPGAPFKQQYAELQMMMKEGSGVDKALNLLQDKKIQIDELIKSTPETTKTITRTVEKRITEKPIQQPIGKGEQRVSRLAAGVEAKTVEKKLTDSLGSLPEYRQADMKEQSTMATDLLSKDPEKAIEIALGKRTPPANILPESVFVAVENKALSEGNIDLLKQLASSVRVGEATAMGQRIRALAERNADSPIGAMKDVIDARVKATEKRFKKSVSQAIKDETARIKAKVKVPDKYDWNAFVESIKC